MKRTTAATLLLIVTATTAAADDYRKVSERSEFMTLLSGKNLSNRLYGVNLAVGDNGQISGTGAGWDITGSWSWEDGFFCREMNWGGDPIPYNCQLVEVRNGNEMRFTVDQGAGDAASFKLR